MPKIKESVTYIRCTIQLPMRLKCYHGPLDGEQKSVDPSRAPFHDLYDIWDFGGDEARVEVYETCLRYTLRRGCEGVVLRWIAP